MNLFSYFKLCFLTLLFGVSPLFAGSSFLDFDLLMGKDLPCWQFIRTKEDWHSFDLFRANYEKRGLLFLEAKQGDPFKIPKIIHLVWLGSAEFPKKSRENLKKWRELHPDWAIKFW